MFGYIIKSTNNKKVNNLALKWNAARLFNDNDDLNELDSKESLKIVNCRICLAKFLNCIVILLTNWVQKPYAMFEIISIRN